MQKLLKVPDCLKYCSNHIIFEAAEVHSQAIQ
jgi:hypothetical protein